MESPGKVGDFSQKCFFCEFSADEEDSSTPERGRSGRREEQKEWKIKREAAQDRR